MAIIPYDSIETAEQRSAEFWEAVRGDGWQPGNVTTRLYGTRERTGDPEVDADLPEGVDYAIQVTERKPYRLDPLIADQVMTALEAVPVAEFYPAWAVGQDLEIGDIRTYTDGNLYVTRQAHTTQVDWSPPVVTPTLFMVYRADADTLLDWIAGEKVELGWQRTFDGSTYECIQAHVTEFSPNLVPALWSLVQPDEPQPWVQPTGAHDAYDTGDRVTYIGYIWESTIDANVWAPGVFGWTQIEPI